MKRRHQARAAGRAANRGDGVQEKLNAASAFAIGELSLASTLIIDGEPDAALRQQLVQSGVEIVPFSGSAAGAQGA
jgi:DeoR/GlpR family transcriptional regulator of sugar metabolism